MKPRAILSVSDKTGIVELGRELAALGYEIVSTGGTADMLAKNGIAVIPIENVTGFPECLDGRVKTLHPRIFGGILAVRDNENHMETLNTHSITPVDIIISNLYPFRETVKDPGCTLEEAIEKIDIGGPSMIRAAAKNYKYVAVVIDPGQYDELITRLKENRMDENYRYQLAVQVFTHTASYDKAVAEYLTGKAGHI